MASKVAFAIACIELYGQLWAELERFEADERTPQDPVQASAIERLEILRLEIHLLMNACERARWRILLTVSQRCALKATLRGLQLALETDPEQISGDAIAAAQNRLFDAILELGTLSLCAPASMRRVGS
jgi:hypothetical protein